MPSDLKGKELLARHTSNADRTALREFADLAERLGFESPEITALKEYPRAKDARNPSDISKPLLVTDGPGVKKKRRCGLPSVKEYMEDSESLFINHLHDVDEEQGEGITSFFVRKSIYSAFFGKPSPLSLEGLHPRNNAVEREQALERQELERQEQERQDREKREERQEQEGREQERQELERQELERQELERQELERQERGRRELERQKRERRELERQKLEKQRQEERDREEKAKQQTKRIHARKEHHGRVQRVKLKKIRQGRLREQAHEGEEWQRPQNPNMEDEMKLGDQQRIGLDELLDSDQDVDLQPGKDIYAASSGARLEEASSNTTVRINFKIRDGGIWKPASAHTIERADYSEIEKAAMNWVRGKWRLFNTELRMLAPQQCYDVVIADGTYTILLIRESEIDIDTELLLSAMNIGIEANEQGRCFETQDDLEEI